MRTVLSARREKGCGLYLQPAGQINYAIRKIIANTATAGASGGSCDLRFRTGTPECVSKRGPRSINEASWRRAPVPTIVSGTSAKAARRAD